MAQRGLEARGGRELLRELWLLPMDELLASGNFNPRGWKGTAEGLQNGG